MATSLFQNFIPQTQKNIQFRSDEGAYGMMVASGDSKFKYTGNSQDYNFIQMWIAGKNGTNNIRKKGEYPQQAARIFVKYNNGVRTNYPNLSTSGFHFSIPNVGPVGYTVSESTIEKRPGYRYGDSVGMGNRKDSSNDFEASDVMVQYSFYADSTQKFPTKDPEATKPSSLQVKDQLKAILTKIANASDGIYKVKPDKDAVILMDGNTQ